MVGTPGDRRYTKDHEWVKIEGDIATVGITEFAQSELGDVTFVETPKVGQQLAKGESFGVVESVKAVSDIYAPVSGEVVEVNDTLTDQPETVNTSPYDDAWMIKIRMENSAEVEEGLLDAGAYEDYVRESGH